MSVLVYSFRTFQFIEEVEQISGEKPFVFGKLKQDLEEFKKLVLLNRPDVIWGITKSPFNYSVFEAKAINAFNQNKSVIKGSKQEYLLNLPDQIPAGFKIRKEGSDSFCNWTMYKVANFIEQQNLNIKLVFCHVKETDLKAALELA